MAYKPAVIGHTTDISGHTTDNPFAKKHPILNKRISKELFIQKMIL